MPRKRVAEMIDRHGVHHIEVDSGDVFCWHSSMWHYSPPNTSDQGRIAGVYTNPQITTTRSFTGDYYWALKDGKVCEAFLPEVYPLAQTGSPEPFAKAADAVTAL